MHSSFSNTGLRHDEPFCLHVVDCARDGKYFGNDIVVGEKRQFHPVGNIQQALPNRYLTDHGAIGCSVGGPSVRL